MPLVSERLTAMMSRRARKRDAEAREQCARDLLAEVRADIVHADQKGALVLASVGLVFGVVLTASFEERLKIGSSWTDWQEPATWASALWWLGAAAAAWACVLAAACVWPRYTRHTQAPAQIAYWGDAAWYTTLPKFGDAWAATDPDRDSRSMSQLWFLSRVVARKYALIRMSMISAAAAGLLLVVAAVINAL